MIRTFISYSHADEDLRQELDKHLASLKHQGIIDVWNDRRMEAGDEWAQAIDSNLKRADVILLLVSSDFIASRYCYEIELEEAMRRHETGEAVVIPVILRVCAWQALPLGKLQSATPNGKPITKYPTLDEGFFEVVQSVKAAVNRIAAKRGANSPTTAATTKPSKVTAFPTMRRAPRSSNLHAKKKFTDHDRDTFRIEAFEYIANFFENSLLELEARNLQLKSQFRRRDANSLEAAVYENGKQAARCGIWLSGSRFGGDIFYNNAGLGNGNSYNESLSVGDDGNILGLNLLGLSNYGEREKLLTLEGAAEYYWSLFIRPLQEG